jgi:hypothetical protein
MVKKCKSCLPETMSYGSQKRNYEFFGYLMTVLLRLCSVKWQIDCVNHELERVYKEVVVLF